MLNFNILLTIFLFCAFNPSFAQQIPDYTYFQTYLAEPPYGLNAYYAWQFPGGKGNGVKIVDIEGGWNINHYDLDANTTGSLGNNSTHGTAVMGIMIAEENDFGITGFAPNASAQGEIYNDDSDITVEINNAMNQLNIGDIILIEMHVDVYYPPNETTYRQMPAEFLPIYLGQWGNREAIKNAVDAGYVVIEVAGNGGNNLDPFLQNLLQIEYTGAIMVAATTPSD